MRLSAHEVTNYGIRYALNRDSFAVLTERNRPVIGSEGATREPPKGPLSHSRTGAPFAPPEIRVDARKIRGVARRFSLNAAERQTPKTLRKANGPSPCNCLAKSSNEDLGHSGGAV